MTHNTTTPKINTFLYFILYPAHLVALATILLFPIFFDYTIKHVVYLVVGWIMFAGIGSAITLHRIVSHRALELRYGLKPIVLWIASMCLQGSPLGWASVHRGAHHKFSDTERDAHTPTKGILYAYHTWLLEWEKYYNPKYVVDLLKDKTHIFIAHNYIKIVLGTYLIVGLISWEMLVFMFIIPAVYSLHQESMVNVLCHLPSCGYRNFDTSDLSRNVPLLAYLGWGQAWHNNHHAKASAYDFGTTVSGKWWEFDPALLLVPLLATKQSRQKIFKGRKHALANASN